MVSAIINEWSIFVTGFKKIITNNMGALWCKSWKITRNMHWKVTYRHRHSIVLRYIHRLSWKHYRRVSCSLRGARLGRINRRSWKRRGNFTKTQFDCRWELTLINSWLLICGVPRCCCRRRVVSHSPLKIGHRAWLKEILSRISCCHCCRARSFVCTTERLWQKKKTVMTKLT